MNPKIKTFWESTHKRGNDPGPLSGNGENTLDILMARISFDGVKTLLNIGVGFGTFERYCVEQGKAVDSLDVAFSAREKINGVSRYFYTEPEALPDAEYDMVTECLVALHLDDAEMERHIKHALRSLKQGGLYAFNAPDFIVYDEAAKQKRENQDVGINAMISGYYMGRPISWYAEKIKEHGGRLTLVSFSGAYTECNTIHYIYHARKV